MAEMPEGAQLSEDGQWWWDGSQWQPVAEGQGGAQPGGEGGGQDAGTPAFDFDMSGVRIDPENSPVPSAGEALKAGFAVCNVGTAAGSAHVTITIDGQDSGVTWDSPEVRPGDCATPDGDGYVHGLPGQSEGSHTFVANVTPAGPNGGSTSNTIDVGSAEQ